MPHIHEHTGCASCGQSCGVKTELPALLRQISAQNVKRANELVTLAGRFEELGDHTAAEQLRRAAGDYDKGNMRLQTVLAALSVCKEEGR